ncbi:MAG TPA: hypothetical protein VGN60_02675 [Devosia sp.]|jgi:hypothetical protein|nr:hypothetical protein [Devosia sp.]
MRSQSAPVGDPAGRSSLAYNSAAIAVFVLLLAVGAAYLVDELARANRAVAPSLGDANPITQTISGRELSIPTAWFRYGEQIRNGFTDQIDLRILYAPPGLQAPLPVDITLLPRSRARVSSRLLDGVYLHQFGEETLRGVPGLVGKPMQAGGAYGGESVWYDALSPDPFVAKCAEPVTSGSGAQCVRTVYLPSGIAATYAFDATLLPTWRQFDAEMQRWLAPIGAW